MRARTSWERRVAALVMVLLVAATAATAFLYIKNRQDVLADRFKNYLTRRLSETFDLRIRIGSLAGDLRGTVALRDVSVAALRKDAEPLTVFTCGEVRFRYSLLDFFRENFTSWFDVILERPTFYANVPFSAQAPEARSFDLFSGFVQKVKSSARLIIKDGTIAWLGKEGTLSGIGGIIENRSFDLSVTLNHLKLGKFDATTTIRVEGRIFGDDKERPLHLKGSASTQGTVINWKPLPGESEMQFDLSEDKLKIWNAKILGGIGIEGSIGHSGRNDIDLMLTAKDYPLREMHDMLSFSGSSAIGGQMSGRLKVQGAVTEPRLVGELAIEDNNVQGARFRAMQLFFEGIFPQVKISRSQLILSNGNPMQFSSDQEIHIHELFSTRTYEKLIARSDQRTITWKNWTLYREEERDTVLLEHPLLGGRPSGVADAPYISADETDGSESTAPADTGPSDPDSDAPPSLETLLSGQESFKMELKDDEQLFALQKKATF